MPRSRTQPPTTLGGDLDAFYEAYAAAGASEHGIEIEAVLREVEDSGAARAATRQLVHGGYLEAVTDVDQSDVKAQPADHHSGILQKLAVRPVNKL
jgi:hypothetical protein